jgi:predicted phage terminase large subunit-like protein
MDITPKALRLSLTRRSLSRFAQVVMPSFEVSRLHKLMIEHVQALERGEINKLAMVLPPRHTKTTLGNIILPAFALGRNPTETIITASYGSDLSETWGRRVRNILGDPAFQQVFPDCKLSPDSAASYRFTTTAGGEYTATGRGGPITGRGASLLVLDDLIKDSSEANSDTITRGIIEWLQQVAFTRLTPKGRILAVATRWSERDPMGWMMSQPGWTILHLPALAESADDPLGREIGEALWPSQYSREALEQIRADIGSRAFQCLYQGNVSAAQGTIFKRDWFRHYDQAPSPESFSRIVQSWDCAFKTGAANDYSVCATFGEAKNGFYLLSLYRGKIEFPELKRKVGELADFWRPSEIYIEDRASGQSLVQELKVATTYPVIAIKVDRDKETRASACTGYFEAGKILFPKDAAWLPDLEDELASFPGGLHDDCVDAICQALNRLRGNGDAYGVLELMRDINAGRRRMPGEVRVSGYRAVECPPCLLGVNRDGSKKEGHATRYSPTGQILCDCGGVDGVMPAKSLVGNICSVEGCELAQKKIPMVSLPGGAWWCQNHGQFAGSVAMAKQMTWKQYKAGARARSFGMGQFAIEAHSDDEISDKISRMFDLHRDRRYGGRP